MLSTMYRQSTGVIILLTEKAQFCFDKWCYAVIVEINNQCKVQVSRNKQCKQS